MSAPTKGGFRSALAFAVGSPFRLRVPQYPDHTFPLDDTRPPWVTHVSSPPCRPQTPWCDEEEPYAFALVLRARPFPVFGRPVHPWARALRLRPGGSPQTLQTPPCGGRPALQKIRDVGSRSAYLSPGFRRRASLASPYLSSLLADEALPPSLDIDPGPRVEWDFNPPETCAARRTIRASPPPHSAPSNRHRHQVGRHDRPRYRASRVARVLPLCTCHRHYPGTATRCSHRSLPQSFQPSPHGLTGRPVHRPFRDPMERG